MHRKHSANVQSHKHWKQMVKQWKNTCLFNLTRWCYVPGGTYTQLRYSIMVYG